jgi:antitoxin (DNA-binding transcriptional repressor) of toxin-antitoxin stability system
MYTVSVRALKDQLSSCLQRAERGERIVVLRDGQPMAGLIPLSQLPEVTGQQRLAELESHGLVTLPRRTERGFKGPTFPNRGKLASEMVSEDRR